MALEKLSPGPVWRHFEQYCAIPHPSKHESVAADYVVDCARRAGYDARRDRVGNIAVDVPATADVSTRNTILQCHLDMVPQKNNDITFDFLHDPIQPVIDGEWVRAQGTTLGADNGIGVAIALALIENNDIPHGPLTVLFTTDEETGMTGALGLEHGFVRGDLMINLDTEDEGELCVGCAGGVDVVGEIPVLFEPSSTGERYVSIEVTGLRGGHSGLDINLGRGNAIRILARLLHTLTRHHGCKLGSASGGTARNAIPREAACTLMIPPDAEFSIEETVSNYNETVANELAIADPDVKIRVVNTSAGRRVLTAASQIAVINFLYGCPIGPSRMSDRIEGVVETSNNLATITTKEKHIRIECLVRSLIDSARDDLAGSVESVFRLAGANIWKSNGYPGWQPNPSSGVVTHMQEVYRRMYGSEMAVRTVHAGLECGIIGAVLPDLDMVSCGPTIRHPHSPSEKIHIGSVKKFWDFLLETLRTL